MGNSRRAIDAIARVKRRWGKLHSVVTAGGRRFLVLKDESTLRFLVEGSSIAPDDLAILEGSAGRAAGLALAYRLLAVRDRTEKEIRSALEREGVSARGTVEEIVATLKRQGYLDDRRLASNYVRYVARHHPSGADFIRRKLRDAGVSEEIAEEELREVLTREKERELAISIARKKMRGASSREQAARRINSFLARRGFDIGIVNSICSAILKGELLGEEE